MLKGAEHEEVDDVFSDSFNETELDSDSDCPGYVSSETEMDEELWQDVDETDGVEEDQREWVPPLNDSLGQPAPYAVPANRCGTVDTAYIPSGSTAFHCFTYVFDEDFFNMVKEETNRNAAAVLSENDKKTWQPLTTEMVHKFFCGIIHASLVWKPGISDYFTKEFGLYTPFMEYIDMDKNTFIQIMRYLHVSNNEHYISRGQPGHDPIFKIRRPFEHILRKLKVYVPNAELIIEEGACPFLGKVSFGVYPGNKPNPFDVRLETVCDSRTGVLCHMEILAGENTGVDNSVNALVQRLLVNFTQKNHHVYMNKKYSSVALFETLLQKGIYCIGTAHKSSRWLPASLKTGRLQRGKRDAMQCGDILATRWKDRRHVYLLSTVHKDEMVVDPRGNTRPKDSPIQKPATVVAYRKYKIGADRKDQAVSYTPFQTQTMKWWKKLFLHLFHVGMEQANRYYNISNKTFKTREDFILEVLDVLLEQLGIPPMDVDDYPLLATHVDDFSEWQFH